jgi:hypothetical protein
MKNEVIAIAADAEAARLRDELSAMKKKYLAALKQLEAEQAAVRNLTSLAGVRAKRIPRAKAAGKRPEATVVLVVSDWHVEETVDPRWRLPTAASSNWCSERRCS